MRKLQRVGEKNDTISAVCDTYIVHQILKKRRKPLVISKSFSIYLYSTFLSAMSFKNRSMTVGKLIDHDDM